MATRPTFPLMVFYDGSCWVCAAEMAHYRDLRHGGQLLFIDISAADFDPALYGRSLDEFMAQLHVRDAAGRDFLGVDAFPPLWQALPGPGYRILAHLVPLPGIHRLASWGYRLFARLRPYLPKRSTACRKAGGSCHLGHRR